MDRRGPGHSGAKFGHRLHHQGGLGDAEAGAAVLLRHCDAEPTGLRHCGIEGVGEARRALAFQPVGIVETSSEAKNLGANFGLCGGQGEVH